MGRNGTSPSTGLPAPTTHNPAGFAGRTGGSFPRGKAEDLPSLHDYEIDYGSNASPAYMDGLEKAIKRTVGDHATVQHLIAATGAPKGSTITVERVDGDRVKLSVSGAGLTMWRKFGRDALDQPYIENGYFRLTETGTGKGTKIFNDQVQAAAKAGFKYIQTHAASGTAYNGYYTWPRLGYDAPIPIATRRLMGGSGGFTQFKGSTKVSDLMKTPEGRAFWKEYGSDLRYAKFDLTPGSQSRQVLAAYLKGK